MGWGGAGAGVGRGGAGGWVGLHSTALHTHRPGRPLGIAAGNNRGPEASSKGSTAPYPPPPHAPTRPPPPTTRPCAAAAAPSPLFGPLGLVHRLQLLTGDDAHEHGVVRQRVVGSSGCSGGGVPPRGLPAASSGQRPAARRDRPCCVGASAVRAAPVQCSGARGVVRGGWRGNKGRVGSTWGSGRGQHGEDERTSQFVGEATVDSRINIRFKQKMR